MAPKKRSSNLDDLPIVGDVLTVKIGTSPNTPKSDRYIDKFAKKYDKSLSKCVKHIEKVEDLFKAGILA